MSQDHSEQNRSRCFPKSTSKHQIQKMTGHEDGSTTHRMLRSCCTGYSTNSAQSPVTQNPFVSIWLCIYADRMAAAWKLEYKSIERTTPHMLQGEPTDEQHPQLCYDISLTLPGHQNTSTSTSDIWCQCQGTQQAQSNWPKQHGVTITTLW